MTARRTILAAAILLGIAALFFLRREKAGTPVLWHHESQAPSKSFVDSPAVENQNSRIENLSGASHLANDLNAPGGTIRRDLEILHEVFATWQTNFPRLGNPVGENAEITAALAGENSVRFAFIPPRHRAIDARGELVDRWGTPFRFHQLSGTQMEIRSAGPDRKFGTADDAEYSPASLVPVMR